MDHSPAPDAPILFFDSGLGGLTVLGSGVGAHLASAFTLLHAATASRLDNKAERSKNCMAETPDGEADLPVWLDAIGACAFNKVPPDR